MGLRKRQEAELLSFGNVWSCGTLDVLEIKHRGQTQIVGRVQWRDSDYTRGRMLRWRPEEYGTEEIYGCGERGHEFSWRETQRTG